MNTNTRWTLVSFHQVSICGAFEAIIWSILPLGGACAVAENIQLEFSWIFTQNEQLKVIFVFSLNLNMFMKKIYVSEMNFIEYFALKKWIAVFKYNFGMKKAWWFSDIINDGNTPFTGKVILKLAIHWGWRKSSRKFLEITRIHSQLSPNIYCIRSFPLSLLRFLSSKYLMKWFIQQFSKW